jgi:hypothetical protein
MQHRQLSRFLSTSFNEDLFIRWHTAKICKTINCITAMFLLTKLQSIPADCHSRAYSGALSYLKSNLCTREALELYLCTVQKGWGVATIGSKSSGY